MPKHLLRRQSVIVTLQVPSARGCDRAEDVGAIAAPEQDNAERSLLRRQDWEHVLGLITVSFSGRTRLILTPVLSWCWAT